MAALPDDASGRSRACPVLVGRDDLLTLVLRRLDEAVVGRGELLLLTGEAGVGKTRLLAEVCGRARAAGVRVVRGAAFPRDAEVVGGLLTDVVTSGVVTSGLVTPHGSTSDGSTDDAAPTPGRGASDAIRAALDVAPVHDAGEQRRLVVTRLAAALLAWGDRPTLVALEDVHWTDEVTLAALERVAAGVVERRLLVVATCRSDELYPRAAVREWRARLLNGRRAEEARVGRLDLAGTAAMVEAILGQVPPVDLVAAVHGRGDGIPLHTEELLAVDADAVPETLAEAVLARAGELTKPARAVLDAAAIVGRTFDVDLLAAVTAEPPDVVDAALVELVERFFVEPSDERTYGFRHALIRDAVERAVPPLRRRALHAAVARAAGAAGLGDAYLSDQLEQAAEPARAAELALRGARAAAALSGHREAVELYRRAQRTLPASAPPAERVAMLRGLADALAATDDNAAAVAAYVSLHALLVAHAGRREAAAVVPALVAVQHLLGASLDERVGRLDAALGTLDTADPDDRPVAAALEAALAAAYMLARRLDESIEHGEAARALSALDDPVRLHVDATLASVLLFAGRRTEALALFDTALPAALDAHAPTEVARTYRMAGSSLSVLVEYDLADRWLRAGIAYSDLEERWNDRHYMAAHAAHVAWATGDWDAAASGARAALADGRGGLTTRITALHVLGFVALGRGAGSAPIDELVEARVLGEQMDELQRLSPALWGLAEHALLAGDVDACRRWCAAGMAASRRVDDAAYAFPFVVTGTRAALAAGDLTGARSWVEQLADLPVRRPIAAAGLAVEHARGLVELAEGHVGAARARLTAAADGWTARRRWWEGAWARLDLAQALVRSRGSGAAARLVDAVRVEAEVRGARPLVERSALLAAPLAPAGLHGPLSPREREVAVLVATGATNADIARALDVTPRTVATHVEHILSKLQLRRRAEVAAWVVRDERR